MEALADPAVTEPGSSEPDGRRPGTRLGVVIINYRTPDLVIDCLTSLEDEVDAARDVVIVVDNDSADGSDETIERAIEARGWSTWARLVRAGVNGGFSAGNNVGMRAVRAKAYLLLNSDTLVRPGAVSILLDAMRRRPDAGLIAPRLEWPDGRPQVSCFRFKTPLTELVAAAGTGVVTRALSRHDTPLPVSSEPIQPDWASFAGILVRREVVEQIGLMDERYFMYYEDIDYCRRARAAGWTVHHEPRARVVHLRGGSSSVKSDAASRRRLPRYYYESRAHYYRRFYGGAGLLAANALWTLGRAVAWGRELVGSKKPHTAARELWDNWSARPQGGRGAAAGGR